jgi:CDP-4-dehydro-6-deoxyglucose reductase
VADIEVRTLPCKVQSIEHLNHDVTQIFLKIPNAESLQYLAGQYIVFSKKEIPFGSFQFQ